MTNLCRALLAEDAVSEELVLVGVWRQRARTLILGISLVTNYISHVTWEYCLGGI